MSNHAENFRFRFQVGHVNNPKTFIRAQLHNDPNVRAEVSSLCGSNADVGSVVIRIAQSVPTDALDIALGPLLGGGYSDLLSQGVISEYLNGNDRWIKLPLDQVAGGAAAEFLGPLTESGISGNLNFAMETDSDGHAMSALKAESRSVSYAVLKSGRIQLSTNLNKEQLEGASGLISGITGINLRDFHSFFGNLTSES